jgi:hypothetical protein
MSPYSQRSFFPRPLDAAYALHHAERLGLAIRTLAPFLSARVPIARHHPRRFACIKKPVQVDRCVALHHCISSVGSGTEHRCHPLALFIPSFKPRRPSPKPLPSLGSFFGCKRSKCNIVSRCSLQNEEIPPAIGRSRSASSGRAFLCGIAHHHYLSW